MDWTTDTLAFHTNYFDLCRACVCPCVEINDIAHLLMTTHVAGGSRRTNRDVSCCISNLASLLLDIPICFGAIVAKERFIDPILLNENEENDHSSYDEPWEPDENSSPDWWPAQWFAFYSCAAFETCCSAVCCGPKIRHANFPLAYALCLVTFYPVCICPLSCAVRQGAKEKLHIQSESCVSTCARASLCIPCSLIQVRKTLEATQQPPMFYNHM